MELLAAEAPLDRLARHMRGWSPPRTLVLGGWLALAAAVLAWILVPGDRRAFAVVAWTIYLLWQAFILCRSKSLSWSACGGFLIAGALMAGPLIAAAPVLQEPLKLLPLVAFLAGTARARSLGVADVALAGFAVGAGFGLLEESLRALAFDEPVVLPVWALFPTPFPAIDGRAFAGHAVTTGLVALGIGFALRFASRWGAPVWLLPAVLLAGATFDHAAYNAAVLPGWLAELHQRLGAGTGARPLLLAGLIGAVALDYRDLHRLRGMPLLPDRIRVEPVGELVAELRAVTTGLPAWVETCAFIRIRHQLGFALLDERRAPGSGDLRPQGTLPHDPYTLVERRRRLVALLVGATLPSPDGSARPPPGAAQRRLAAGVDHVVQRIPGLQSAVTRSLRGELARRDPDALRARRGVTASRDDEILRENREDILGVDPPKGWRTYRLVRLSGPGMPFNHEANGVELPQPPSDEHRRLVEQRVESATSADEALAILREAGERLRRGLPPSA
jgi:protease prsW family protein